MKYLLPITVVLALLAVPAQAKTVKSDVVLTPTGACMIKLGGGVGCFGDAIPAEYTDGVLWLRKRGRVHHAEYGGTLAPTTDRPKRLRRGDRWNKRGVRCLVIRGGVKCSNGRHGFRLKKRSYRIW